MPAARSSRSISRASRANPLQHRDRRVSPPELLFGPFDPPQHQSTPLRPHISKHATVTEPMPEEALEPATPDNRAFAFDEDRPSPLNLNELEVVKTLGSGTASVFLVRVKDRESIHPLERPGALFAMKVVRKAQLEQRPPEEQKTEIGRLSELPWNPYISGLVSTFMDEINLYTMVEFMPCGTLRSLLQRSKPLSARSAAFYFSNIVIAIDFLHKHNIVHRDIKPENILLRPNGYLALTDFALAKRQNEKSGWMGVGTPPHMAPETMYKSVPPDATIDWWAAGVVLFEMVTKTLPFKGLNNSESEALKQKEIEWPLKFKWGKKLKHLVTRLLDKNGLARLGFSGAQEVINHPWLQNVDWKKMRRQLHHAPYVPKDLRPEQTWHFRPLPNALDLPGLPLADVPIQQQYDKRYNTTYYMSMRQLLLAHYRRI